MEKEVEVEITEKEKRCEDAPNMCAVENEGPVKIQLVRSDDIQRDRSGGQNGEAYVRASHWWD